MFEFHVRGLSEATNLIERGWPSRIISLLSLQNFNFQHRGDHHHIWDVEDVHFDIGSFAPTADGLSEMLAVTAHLTDSDRLLVHCFAGQSRSTAAMIAILIQHGMGPQEAFDAVYDDRDCMMPNQLITRLTDEHFGLNGELIEIVRDYLTVVLKRRPSERAPSQSQVDAMSQIMDLFRD